MPAKINDAKMEEILQHYLQNEWETEVSIAARFGIARSCLASYCRKAGIKRDKKRLMWTPEKIQDLPLMTVMAFCKKYKMSASSAISKRRQLGIKTRFEERPYEYIDTTVYQWPRSKALANHIKELRA